MSSPVGEMGHGTKRVPVFTRGRPTLGGEMVGSDVDPAFADAIERPVPADPDATDGKLLAHDVDEDGAPCCREAGQRLA
ncbi:MAG: hypothetical protein IPM29_02325 [Planctomycetes bacterium]|nr:hypothetical protein [Planctomycetota bacterium]